MESFIGRIAIRAVATKAATSRPAAGPIFRLSHIVLASGSPRRYELLRSLGLTVEVVVSGYAEVSSAALAPAELASFHAGEKLRAVVRTGRIYSEDVPVLAADTVVDLDGTALGKPRDNEQAAWMLEQLSGRDHLVHTAFALVTLGRTGWTLERATTRVRFFSLSVDEIAEYVATGEPLDKAGGYGIQGRAASLIEAIDGDFYTVMGLPLARFIRALRRLGFALPKPNDPPRVKPHSTSR